MKLTPAQLKWLKHARTCGDKMFVANRNAALNQLERLRLIELDPRTSGVYSRWRVTARGLRVQLGESEAQP